MLKYFTTQPSRNQVFFEKSCKYTGKTLDINLFRVLYCTPNIKAGCKYMIILEILKSGAVVNFLTVILGSAVGLLFCKGIPERLKNALMTGMALCVFLIGVDGMLEGKNTLIAIISMAIGGLIVELIDLDSLVGRAASALEKGINKHGGRTEVAEGFTAATLLFCVGAMTIVGSIDSGLRGDNTTLYSKAIIDGISAIALASGLGIGVLFSSVAVLVIQGSITLLASVVAPLISFGDVIAEMTCVGSLLVLALSLNMLGLTKIKVMNFVPAIFIPIILCKFM